MEIDLSNAVEAAQNLLGAKLVHDSPEGRTSGYIVETEAYSAEDAASHSYRGQTERNAVMFGPAGYLYVYFTYGMHYCINVVTGQPGHGQGVLIRALEPIEGLDLMSQRRRRSDLRDLTNGPAKLAQAMGLNMQHKGLPLDRTSAVWLEPGISPKGITTTSRIGITRDTHRQWRFYITDNPYVSKR